jgi:hypothetical protein
MLKKLLVIGSLVATLVVNALANILPFNGITTAQVSDSISTYFVPAGYVFTIWSVIYLGLIIYVIYSLVRRDKIDDKIAIWFTIANITNAIWMFTWHYQIMWLTIILMLVILGSLLMVYTTLSKGKTDIIRTAPFSIYLGWISVATIANVSSVLVFYNWNALQISGEMWATIMIAIATVLTILMLEFKKDILYSLVIVWALIGIMYKFLTISDLMVGAIIVSLIIIFTQITLTRVWARD